ncbi:MAG: tetratricopeptide repeat protein [Planctomycetaceae bacterium]
MAQSASPAAEAPVVESYAPEKSRFTKGGCEYLAERTEEGVYHQELQRDEEGDIYAQRVEVQWAIGSGERGRSYFIDRGGILFLSPLSWYSQRQTWDLSPGFPERGHLRFERQVTGRCLNCHAGRVNRLPGVVERFAHPVVREGAISCERCHGPGREHVAWHQGGATHEGGDPIVNPRKLPPSQRESVCNQCHLQGLDEVLRYGRTDFDFRPGMNLGEVWSVFVEGTGVIASGQTTAVSHVQQMHASHCFQKSDGQLGCISCHDPHRVPTPAERQDFFNSRCANCHADRGCSLPVAQREANSAGASCIDCHMPRLGAADVPHTSQTDHRVLKRPPLPVPEPEASQPATAESMTEPDLQIFDLTEVPLTTNELDRAWGILLAGRAEQRQSPEVAQQALERLQRVWALDRGDGAVADAYGISLALTGETERAIEIWSRGLLANPRSESLLYSLGLAHFTAGRHAEAFKHFDRLVAVNPWRSDYQGQRARTLLALGQMPAALEAATAARELNPSLPLVYEWLAYASEQAGQPEQAARYRQLQQRIRRR